MKQVCQLNRDGYFTGMTPTDPSPLEPGVFLMPGGCIDVTPPNPPAGQRAKWVNGWVYEDIPLPPEPEPVQEPEPPTDPEPEPVHPTVQRIHDLMQLLSDTDFKVMPDYDKPDNGVRAQRQAWREEIRALEQTL